MVLSINRCNARNLLDYSALKIYTVTTNPGIEDIVKEEIKEKLGNVEYVNVYNLPGRISFYYDNLEKILKLRSIYHVMRFVTSFKVENLSELYEKMFDVDIEEMLDAKTFRITGKRRGLHVFKSVDIQKVAGKAVQEKYKKEVSLKNFDVEILVELFGKECYIAVMKTRDSLHKRYPKVVNHPTAIKPPLAYAMIKLANVKEGMKILDPFCGSGTIPIEVAQIFGNKVKIYASDIMEYWINGAKENAKNAGVENLIEFKVANANNIHKHYVIKFDRIITNPPYGVKIEKEDLKWLYRNFMENVYQILEDNAKLVIITTRANSFRDLIMKTKKYLIEEERVVDVGTLWPHIFVLRKI